MDDIRIKESTRPLRVALTAEETVEKSQSLFDFLCELQKMEDHKTLEMKRLGEQVKGAKSAVTDCRTIIQLGEYQEVEIEERFDFGKNVVTVVRTDTGEIITERGMIDEDYQEEF